MYKSTVVSPSCAMYGARGGSEYPVIRTTDWKLRGAGNIQKGTQF